MGWLVHGQENTDRQALVGLAELVKSALLSRRYGLQLQSWQNRAFYCTSAVPFYSPVHELNLAIEVVLQ